MDGERGGGGILLKTYFIISFFFRSYELTRKDRLFKNVQRMQQIKVHYLEHKYISIWVGQIYLNMLYIVYAKWVKKMC